MPADATLAILAGGEGSRMGSPKGHLTLAGEPILPYLLHRLQWPGPTLLVTAPGREHPPGHDLFHREVADPVPGQGPLRGLLTALEAIHTPLLLIATVDMPAIRPIHLTWLLDRLTELDSHLGLFCRHRGPIDPQVEPFPAAYRAEARKTVAARLEKGRRSVHGLSREPRFATLDAPLDWPEATWTNLNSPQDLQQFDPLA